MKFIALINLGSENSSTGMGGGPTPLACTRSPQKGWSPKKGTMVVGHYISTNLSTKGTNHVMQKCKYLIYVKR